MYQSITSMTIKRLSEHRMHTDMGITNSHETVWTARAVSPWVSLFVKVLPLKFSFCDCRFDVSFHS